MQVYVCECSGYNLNMRMRELFLFMSVDKQRQGLTQTLSDVCGPLLIRNTAYWP